MSNVKDPTAMRIAPLSTPTDLMANAVRDIFAALNILLADVFALYLKTKNFHWCAAHAVLSPLLVRMPPPLLVVAPRTCGGSERHGENGGSAKGNRGFPYHCFIS